MEPDRRRDQPDRDQRRSRTLLTTAELKRLVALTAPDIVDGPLRGPHTGRQRTRGGCGLPGSRTEDFCCDAHDDDTEWENGIWLRESPVLAQSGHWPNNRSWRMADIG